MTFRNTSDICKEAEDFCSEVELCTECPAYGYCRDINKAFSALTDDELMPIVEAFRKNNTAEHDPVNHPSHYCREGAMESIDEMRLIFGDEAVKHFCLCNAWKYRYRAADKNGAEDMAKSDWYIKKYKELKR